jgi:CHAT domain-containing protein/Tfp pilus assembly protein PilF
LAWKYLLLEANILSDQGDDPRVVTLLETGLAKPPPPGDLAVERSMFKALAYSRMGDFEKADSAYREAGDMCPGNACGVAGELARIGGCIETDRGRLEPARQFFTSSLEIGRKKGDDFLNLSNLFNLGVIAIREQHYDESIEWFSQAQALSKQMHVGIGEEKALGNLGWGYYKMGDYEKSLDLSRQAVARARELGIGIDEVEWLNNVETIHLKRRQFALAEPEYQRSLQLARQSRNRRQEVDALSALAYINLQTGNLDRAAAFLDPAIALNERAGDSAGDLYPRLIRGRILAQRGEDANAERIFTEVARDAKDDASLRWEAEDALAGLYARQRQWQRADAEYRLALRTVSDARCDIDQEELRMPFLTNATQVYADYLDFLAGQGKTVQALKTADESRALTLAEGLRIRGSKCLAAETGFDARRTARRARATVLFYWIGEQHSYVWAISPAAPGSASVKMYPLPPAARIEPLVEAYRRALLGPRDALDSAKATGEMLYATLVAPAASDLHGGERLVVIADGSLSGLNFETLIVPGEHPHYLIEDVTVENALSLRLLDSAPGRRQARHSEKAARLLLIGDPRPPAGSDFDALPNASSEMERVGRYFPASDRQVLRQGGSTPRAYVESHPERFAYIHFVAHGTASLTDPLDSAVVLSRPSSSAEQGGYKLYAREIIAHPLNAGLVTIASCKGAGTRAYTGEGLVGLSWAFLHAGAHQVIGALWDVSDEATPELMDAMYAELVKGRPPDEALRTAKLALLHSGAPFNKPYYWAAFQLYTGS